ncbi:hypothetical protein GCG54_00013113 [Colletotrichum gloeosporioides]|uniref:BTB domain-containing protein n=1 Tax=Colletotrichum gloeosporioides TaxID=474922 RepID=A0A8H4C5C2_COLGL|nr:uncharacterized protein GCG54_00013113 [Colletotrichum gloeosporioides]KAF3797590.1 hypothetical protein GCG54_00013113 [Colletotrichum gloeosporioides]
MSADAVEELRSSLKHLYNNPEFSDLTIASRENEYHVHKAVVCPRSSYFAEKCREAKSQVGIRVPVQKIHLDANVALSPQAATDGCLNLPDDDPQAVGMVIRYFYQLDYPSEPSTYVPQTNGHAHANEHTTDDDGPNGSIKSDDAPLDKDIKAEDPGETLDDFLPPQPQRTTKKQKKRAKAQAKAGLGSPEPQGDSLASPVALEASLSHDNHSEAGGAVLESKPPATRNGNIAVDAKPAAASVVNTKTNGIEAVAASGTKSLVLHANVYALSRKYGIAGLRSLSFDKFQAEADSQWHTEEFLRAAEKVYTSCSGGDDDRKMKDVVVGMICRHGEMMDKAETQKVMRTLPKDLMYDILMQVRQQGGFAI